MNDIVRQSSRTYRQVERRDDGPDPRYPARNFTSRFCVNVGDLGRSRPHHKATSHPQDWYSLAMLLDAGLCLAASREAFAPFGI